MHIAILVAAAALSVGLRLVVPVQAIAGGYDDLLFIRLAESLCRGDWLGPYDNLTLAKGIGYPAFLCASSWLGLPLRLAEHLLYLLACAVSALAVRGVSGSRSIATGTFAALALMPIFWGADLSRVIREDIYIPLSLLVVSCAVLAYAANADQPLRRRLPSLFGLGIAAAGYWLTREETPWLYPAVGLLVLYWLVIRWRALRQDGLLFSRRGLTALTVPIIIPATVAGGVILTVCILNFSHYGVFRDNDFRQGPFAAAYGALSRIQYQTPWKRYLAFPADARQVAYSVSPAAAELRPFLEGPKGLAYQSPGFGSYDTTGFMWVLRDAVADIGGYASAGKADAYYRRLAAEINAACDRGTIPCLPARSTFMPPGHPGQIAETLASAYDFYLKAAGIRSGPVGARPSIGDDATMRRFAAIIHSQPTPLDGGSAPADIRVVSGWAYSPAGPLSIGADQKSSPVKLDLQPAGDVLQHFGTPDAAAIRFRVVGPASAALTVTQGATVARLPLSAQPGSSPGAEGGIALYVDQSTSPQMPADHIGGSPVTDTVTSIYRAVGPCLVSCSLIWLAVITPWSVLRRRRIDGLLVASLAVTAAFATRILLVSFLNVTALRSDYHYLYVSPAAPFGILIVSYAAATMLNAIRLGREKRMASAVNVIATRRT